MTCRVDEAIILAAGIGKRLKPFTDNHPKSLLEVEGRTLMERHLAHLEAGGVPGVTIVVGHCAEQIQNRFGDAWGDLRIRYVMNEEYLKGSVLSLRHGLASLDDTVRRVAWMDADVIYHEEVLHRLLASEPDLCFLLDPTADDSGEEMMIGAREGRVLHIDRGVGPGFDETGESVGFFAVGPEALPELKAMLDEFATTGRENAEYEEALHATLPSINAGYVEVGDLPWTEIDFPEDVEKAEEIAALLRA